MWVRKVIAIGTVLLAAISPGAAVAGNSASFVDSMGQQTVRQAADAFTSSMAQHDYFAAYYLLSPDAKDAFAQALERLQIDSFLLDIEGFAVPGSVFSDRAAPRVLVEDMADNSQVFDDLMASGAKSGLLPFSFDGAALTGVKEDGQGASATVEVSTGPSPLTIHLTKVYDNSWRVEVIRWDGSGAGLPWDAEKGSSPVPPSSLASARTLLEGLHLDSPAAVVEQFVLAYSSADYFKAYFLLSPAAKRAPLDPSGGLFLTEQFLPGINTADLPGIGLFRKVARADALALDTMRDPALVFHRLLLAADRQGKLPFDLQAARVSKVQEIGPVEDETGVKAQARVDVATSGDPDELTFHLIQLPNEQWRVDQIRWEGSLEWARPF